VDIELEDVCNTYTIKGAHTHSHKEKEGAENSFIPINLLVGKGTGREFIYTYYLTELLLIFFFVFLVFCLPKGIRTRSYYPILPN
jgi:hypothetical protein